MKRSNTSMDTAPLENCGAMLVTGEICAQQKDHDGPCTPNFSPIQKHIQYPPCDYCGCIPDQHPWHGSGSLNGEERRHIHACEDCRDKLPSKLSDDLNWLRHNCKCEVSIRINPFTLYETVEFAVEQLLADEEIEQELADLILKERTFTQASAYVDTPVGYVSAYHASVEEAVAQLRKHVETIADIVGGK